MVQVLIMEVVSDREHAYVRKLYQDLRFFLFAAKSWCNSERNSERRRVPRH